MKLNFKKETIIKLTKKEMEKNLAGNVTDDSLFPTQYNYTCDCTLMK